MNLPRPAEEAAHRTVTVRVDGELDHETCADLLRAVAEQLAARPGARMVRVDCRGMSLCDSMGLSALLQLRRDADAAGRRLVLDRRPAHLDRLLHLTGTAAYLLADPAG
ncbi:STAS domain-containing protein [Streptomyces sp. TLI_171]|uniref:STAS domain-containing protein n=1 Tax=Streptomyces sp. TLI_171 TaxID=1938859 RepID=UPI000C1A177D|nr:STAS domain-containing protein [Streptomyces sp. TLI_171]RKE17376.1 anti-sigma-factor antagonist [Streptomyces sp. TLI_171]